MSKHISTAYLKRQALFWLGAALIFILFVYVFRSVLLPFVAGLALAYFMDPVADFFERRGLSRMASTIVILLLFVIALVIALAVIVPILITQANDFFSNFPQYVSQLQGLFSRLSLETGWLANYIGINAEDLQGGFKIDAWVPRDHVESVRRLGRDINKTIAGFVRGQGTVCLILGTFYAIGLTVTGLNFGLLIGLFAGLISFIPYVGSLVGLVLSVGVAVVQFWPDWISVVMVAAVFFIGQAIEGNILQPKLVGDSVGLHPVWLMFALFAFGALFGFTGLLIAVPAASAIGVLVRFALEKYLDSDLYVGQSEVRAKQTANDE